MAKVEPGELVWDSSDLVDQVRQSGLDGRLGRVEQDQGGLSDALLDGL
jgi:hypothetical protein